VHLEIDWVQFLSLATYFQAKKNRMALMKAVEEVQKLLTQEKAKNDVLSRDFKDTGSLNIVAKLLSSLCANARVAASCRLEWNLNTRVPRVIFVLDPAFHVFRNASPIKFETRDTTSSKILTARSRSKSLSAIYEGQSESRTRKTSP
jgi:hypothetical protein